MSGELASKGYVAPPSVGHEIGIIFGFLGAMALTTAVYVAAWKYGNKVGQRKEAERIEALKASGWLKEKQEPEPEQTENRNEIPL